MRQVQLEASAAQVGCPGACWIYGRLNVSNFSRELPLKVDAIVAAVKMSAKPLKNTPFVFQGTASSNWKRHCPYIA